MYASEWRPFLEESFEVMFPTFTVSELTPFSGNINPPSQSLPKSEFHT